MSAIAPGLKCSTFHRVLEGRCQSLVSQVNVVRVVCADVFGLVVVFPTTLKSFIFQHLK